MNDFKGFAFPEQNWSKLPHEFIDALPMVNSLGELKVILYVLRHTWGFAEYDEPKRITIDEFMNGRKRRDGSRIDAGVGMYDQAVQKGLAKAVEHGFLLVFVDDSDQARKIREYSLNIPGSENHYPDSENHYPDSENHYTGKRKSLPVQRKKLKKEKDIQTPENQEPSKPLLSEEELAEVVAKGNRDMDLILQQAHQFAEQEAYPNRTMFPAGYHRDFADVYVKHTGQQPKVKNQVSFWMSTFNLWNEAGYTVKVLDIALRYAKAQKPNPLTITHPSSLSANNGGIMAYIDGEVRNGNEFKELFESDAPADKWWKKVGGSDDGK